VCGTLFAQNRAALTIVCNQAGAQVFVAGRLVGTTTPTLSVLLPAGTYAVKVVKTGFPPFDTTVNLTAAGATINVTLGAAPAPTPPPQQATFGLTVNSPAPNTQVLINGNLQGNAPFTIQLVPGTYQVTVRAPNMIEWSQMVQIVNGPVTINPGYQPLTYQVQASATNAPGALIFVNGAQSAQGMYNASLATGTYTILIRAPGFMDYSETFALSGPKVISVALQPLLVTYQVLLQAANLNLDGSGNPAGPIQVFMDGSPIQAAGRGVFTGSVAPGNHTVRIVSGAIKFESTVNLQAGKSWTIEPMLGFGAR
jgi:hypothetical protein